MGAASVDAAFVDSAYPRTVECRVPFKFPVAKLGLAVVFVALALYVAPDPVRMGVAIVVALGLAGFGMRDVLVPVRLAADESGVTVIHGYARRRHLRWDEIERITVDSRRRLLSTSTLLEVDTGEQLYFFSAHELGAPPSEVVDALADLRAGTRQ